MGRFSSVQAYSDTHAGTRTISYEQATGKSSTETSVKAVRPEKVVNPYGSTAGAGSGEFHMYRHARAREMQRLEQIDVDDKERQLDLEFEQTLQQYQQKEKERTDKKRNKRQRQKEAKLRKKNFAKAGIITTGVQPETTTALDTVEEEEEFSYVPQSQQKAQEDTAAETSNDTPQNSFANDGSFLELMKKRLAEEQSKPANDSSPEKEPFAEEQTKPDDSEEPPSKRQAT